MKCMTLLVCLLASCTVVGQERLEDQVLLDLMELLNTPVISASKNAQTVRDAPNIISVIPKATIGKRL